MVALSVMADTPPCAVILRRPTIINALSTAGIFSWDAVMVYVWSVYRRLRWHCSGRIGSGVYTAGSDGTVLGDVESLGHEA